MEFTREQLDYIEDLCLDLISLALETSCYRAEKELEQKMTILRLDLRSKQCARCEGTGKITMKVPKTHQPLDTLSGDFDIFAEDQTKDCQLCGGTGKNG